MRGFKKTEAMSISSCAHLFFYKIYISACSKEGKKDRG